MAAFMVFIREKTLDQPELEPFQTLDCEGLYLVPMCDTRSQS
jgi:hypothetical protein